MKNLVKHVLAAFMLLVVSVGAFAQNVSTYVHPRSLEWAPIFQQELKTYFPEIPQPWYVLALAEHESCIHLKHPNCMSHKSKFSTKWKENGQPRELGAGIAMLTKAWRIDGTKRMDSLEGLKKVYPNDLKDLNWDNIFERPDLQARGMILLMRDDYRSFNKSVPDKIQRQRFADSAYNGGRRDVNTAINRCGMTKGCDPGVWFNNVENHNPKSTKELYSGRSARQINNHHVRDVVLTRMPKYQKVLPNLGEKP